VFELDGSTLRGTGFRQLTDLAKGGNAVLISTKTRRVALVVDAADGSNASAVAEARLRYPVAFFRGNSYDVGRLCLFLQEPIVITDDDGEPVLVLLPRISKRWTKGTSALKAKASSANKCVGTPAKMPLQTKA
jgi:hypothetical protein